MFSSDYGVSNDMYRLRWDAAKQAVDLTSAFENFRNDEELLDVSLICSNKSGRSSIIRAHQLVLAAYSPVFKDMFECLNGKKDPIIFLKGISHDNLSSILDLMYQGCADIPKSIMNEFLADAQELQIKGLRGENNETDDFGDKTRNIKTSAKVIRTPLNKPFQMNKHIKRELEQSNSMDEYFSTRVNNNGLDGNDFEDYDNVTVESEDLSASQPSRPKKKPKSKSETNPLDFDFEALKQESKNKKYTDPASDYEKIRCENMFVKLEGKWVGSDRKRRSVWQCKLCTREVRTDRRPKHLRANHPE